MTEENAKEHEKEAQVALEATKLLNDFLNDEDVNLNATAIRGLLKSNCVIVRSGLSAVIRLYNSK